jgi:hypothetical protein
LRQDLSDWAEKYYMPGKFYRMLVHFGAKRHRCSACRVNFVSFFPRKAEYVNPAKLKRMAPQHDSERESLESDAQQNLHRHQHAGL